MASLEEIKKKLNIVVGDREINPGMCKPMKNRYYNINNEFLVVEFKDNKHMAFSNDAKTRELLSDYVWCILSVGYASNRVGMFHQKYLNYEEGLVCDHINRHRYDNRNSNLRIVTRKQNNRNFTKRSDNSSGKPGVDLQARRQEWRSRIHTDDGKKTKSFSIVRYGNAEAKRMAIEQRLAWEREFGYNGE